MLVPALVDGAIGRVVDAMLACPFLILAIAIFAVRAIGVVVDSVSDVIELGTEQIKPAPELDTAAGKVARDRARQLLPVGAEVVLLSHSLDKYGRALAEVTLPDGRDYADVMLAEGHAVDYATGKPAPP